MGDFSEFDVPDYWYEEEERLFDHLLGGDTFLGNDPELQDMFDTAYFDPDATTEDRYMAREDIRDYLLDEYGIDFDQYFDWEGWRDWYEAA